MLENPFYRISELDTYFNFLFMQKRSKKYDKWVYNFLNSLSPLITIDYYMRDNGGGKSEVGIVRYNKDAWFGYLEYTHFTTKKYNIHKPSHIWIGHELKEYDHSVPLLKIMGTFETTLGKICIGTWECEFYDKDENVMFQDINKRAADIIKNISIFICDECEDGPDIPMFISEWGL